MKKRMCLNEKERREANRIIKENTGYIIRNNGILNQVFRRSSFAAETGENSNEIFEFIGDQVLSYFVVKIISKKCGSFSLVDDYTFRIRENQFTLIKQSLINNEALAKIIDEWGIAKYLILGISDIKNEADKETKVKADLFEAVIGAIAVESNWDTDVLEKAVSKALDLEKKLNSVIENDTKSICFDIDNAVTFLKEMAENSVCTMPEYVFVGPDDIGYDDDGNPNWFCRCTVKNDVTGIRRCVESTSKKAAKKAAAYLVLCELLGAQNKYGPNDWFMIWTYKYDKLLPKRQLNNRGE